MTAPTLDAVTLREVIDSGRAPRLIDVRTPAEFQTAHIPGSYNVPLDLLHEHRAEIAAHLDDDVIVVCRSGQRAATAERALRESGLSNVHILDGGIIAWQAKGFDIHHGTPRWDQERQVRLAAGSIVLGSVLGMTNTCAMGMALAKLPYNRGPKCDPADVVAQIVDARTMT